MDAAQEVVPVDGEPFLGDLVSIGADLRVVFRVQEPNATPKETGSPTTERTLRLDELVRWGHPREPRPQILVVLDDGGRLVTAAAWSGGAPVRLEGKNLLVLTDAWGEVPLPRSRLRGLVFAQRSHPRGREKLEEEVRGESSPNPSLQARGNFAADVVLLTNKDRVQGTLAALSGGSLTLETEAGTVKLPLSRAEAVVFGGRPSSVVSRQSKFVIGLHDGSLVYADGVQGDEKHLRVQTASGLKINGGGVKDVALLQSLGGRFVYLSDLEPDGYRHVPYLSIEWPYRRDRSVLDEPLSVGGRRYLKGIGMHSAARLTYRLDGKYRRFDAAVAVDDSAGKRGSVTFGVYVLRDGKWAEAYTSRVVRGGHAPRPVSVDVASAQGLTLTVDYADRGDELDHADWLDARLVREESSRAEEQ